MASGYGLSPVSSAEVVSAYSAEQRAVPAIPGGAGWHVLGEFFLPLSTEARLEAIGSVSAGGLTASVRLFDLTTKAPVTGTAALSSTSSQRALSGVLQLTGGRRYQIQAQCTGATVDTNFALIQTAALTS